MRRRDLLTLAAAAAAAGAATAAWPGIAAAQRSLLPVAGFLGVLAAAESADIVAAFQQGLNENGFVDGTNVAVETRWAESQLDKLPGLATELIHHKAAVVVTSGSGAATLAAKGPAAGVIPLVFVESDLDPVKTGLVKSLDHPSTDITGVLMTGPNLLSKRLEILQDAAGDPDVIAMLVNPQSLDGDRQPSQALGIAQAMGRKLNLVNVASPDDIDDAFANKLVKPQIGALLVADDVFLMAARDHIVTGATNNNLPTMYPHPAYVVAGGLMSYTADFGDAYKQAGEIAADILLGKKANDIPVRQSSKFALVVNRKTAAALQIPDSVTKNADRIIEGNPNEAAPIWIPGGRTPRPPG